MGFHKYIYAPILLSSEQNYFLLNLVGYGNRFLCFDDGTALAHKYNYVLSAEVLR